MNSNNRPMRQLYYLEMARTASRRSTCLNFLEGAIIVNHDEIIATGYNGAPRGTFNCTDRGTCFRREHNVPDGVRLELCGMISATQNCIISASREKMLYGTMYIYQWDAGLNSMPEFPDSTILSKRMIINSGIEEVVYADKNGICYDRDLGYGFRVVRVSDWANDYAGLLGKQLHREMAIEDSIDTQHEGMR